MAGAATRWEARGPLCGLTAVLRGTSGAPRGRLLAGLLNTRSLGMGILPWLKPLAFHQRVIDPLDDLAMIGRMLGPTAFVKIAGDDLDHQATGLWLADWLHHVEYPTRRRAGDGGGCRGGGGVGGRGGDCGPRGDGGGSSSGGDGGGLGVATPSCSSARRHCRSLNRSAPSSHAAARA